MGLVVAAGADVLYVQAPTYSGTVLGSNYWNPDGSDWDRLMWDGFMLPQGGTVEEIRWQGAYPSGPVNIAMFEISIYASIPGGSQPDLGYLYPGPLVHEEVDHNCGEMLIGSIGGRNWYEYHYRLPQPFHANAGERYWVQMTAWQNGMPNWGFSPATGGNGSHFTLVHMDSGRRYTFWSGDAAFSLVGTPDGCPADLSGSSDPADPAYGEPDGAADSSDFFYFLDQFAAGNAAKADLSGSSDPADPAYGVPDGAIDASDFFYYLDLFVAGCP